MIRRPDAVHLWLALALVVTATPGWAQPSEQTPSPAAPSAIWEGQGPERAQAQANSPRAAALERYASVPWIANTVWTLMASMLVFFMNLGFATLESGLCRRKNTVNILAKNVIVFALAGVAFWVVGFGLMFGVGSMFTSITTQLMSDPEGVAFRPLTWVGTTGFLPSLEPGTADLFPGLSWAQVPESVKFFFHLVFAGTAATIVSGAVAERIRFGSFMLFSLVITAVIYPINGHWVWGGGWLAALGAHDFAGSGVVHVCGGAAALAGVLALGPRLGKFGPAKGQINALPGHSIALACVGAFVLWMGWFGFNPDSTMKASAQIGHIAVTTNTSACFAAVAATLTSWLLIGKPDLSMILNGCLAGLVAITASCAVVSVGSAAIIGVVAGMLVVFGVLMWDRLRVDDPVGALSVHLLNGAWGLLAVGLFASGQVIADYGLEERCRPGLLMGGGTGQLVSQVVNLASTGGFVFVSASVAWLAIKATVGIRVSKEEELEGLDIGEHGMEAYSGFAEAAR